MSPARPALWILAGLAFLAVAVNAENTAKKLLVGDTKVEVLAKYQGDALPKPGKALIYDFAVPPDVISVDQSPAAKLHRTKGQEQGTEPGSPEAVAQQVQASFTKALLGELKQASVAAERAAGGDAPAPPPTLLVQGEFTAIHEGNKTKRVLIGFGKGASDVQAHVTVSLTTDQPQPTVLLEFNVKSQSGKKPGAAATVGAGAATLGTVSAGSAAAGVAAGGVVDRAATVQADASRMAKGVAKQIAALMKSQTWAAPQPSETQPPAPHFVSNASGDPLP
ncbi:MAG TPA: DUF4410 domain-containing protein [Thermoanaerobaculia bacterium]|nr:DUF4410 domain-containing protein [Thermoanaerobaculia bacterium]